MGYRKSIKFSHYIVTDPDPYGELLGYIRPQLKDLSSFKYWKPIHDRHLLLILQNLHLGYQISPETYVAYSRNKNDYSKQEVPVPPVKVAYGPTTRIIDGLAKFGLIEGTKGIYYPDQHVAFRARMRATSVMASFFARIGTGNLQLKARHQLIVLRDEEGRNLPFEETEETFLMRRNLQFINSINQRHFVGLCVYDEVFDEIFHRINSSDTGGTASTELYFGNTDLHRCFCNGTFSEGGRFYGGFWQNLPKEYRKFIRIDNKIIVELDYSCLHPTLLYLEDGLPVPAGDMYEVPTFPPEARKLLKVSMNIMLNAKNRASAKKALIAEMRKNPNFPLLPKGLSIDQLFDGFMEKHNGIGKYFFSSAGRRLQRVDSDIAEAVMLKLVKKNICVLPLHDSFLVSRLHQNELSCTMDRIVSAKYGTEIKVKRDKTSWDLIYDLDIQDEYHHDIEAFEREAIRNADNGFSKYHIQYRKFEAKEGEQKRKGVSLQ
ncbi:hypothetical protein Gbem_3006 [Citrifermentans bemidjiense Bem]|uniref:Uncharacterized protein n=1 Tax=Citrifermentans bemidjiense (strain ATCC BAA-1014 / DSM 16622 / JCM 12645 / Bem) TaxID=404380 RepID=B5E840_CITBB|nr:hypothetical protein [Citrifermentans bemidjiense]ACH40009.1 hypothetical protein Gbem_3006 [Citrifermentans bemidjiense Bem]